MMKIEKGYILSVVICVLMASCSEFENGKDNEVGMDVSVKYTDSDFVLGTVPREKISSLKLLRQISLRPKNENPRYTYLNIAKGNKSFYVYSNYDGIIREYSYVDKEIINIYKEHSEKLYSDYVVQLEYIDENKFLLCGEDKIYEYGNFYRELKNTYQISRITIINNKIYAFNFSQSLSPGYIAFDIYDRNLKHLGAEFDNPFWDNLTSRNIGSVLYMSAEEDNVIISSNIHKSIFYFDMAKGKQSAITLEEMGFLAEKEEHNYAKYRNENSKDKIRETYGPVAIDGKEIYVSIKKGKCIYVIKTNKKGNIVKVYMLKTMERFVRAEDMIVNTSSDGKTQIVIYFICEKKDRSRTFPVCVFEPAD